MSISITLSERTEIEVQLQQSINGNPAGKGVNYPDLDDEAVFGPYQTGCEEGRSCIEVSVEDQEFGKMIEVFLEPEGLIGHWKAETLAENNLYVDGDEVTEWPDSSDAGHDLSVFEGSNLIYSANALNGYPAVCNPYTTDESDGYGGYCNMGTGAIDVSEEVNLTVYVVAKFKNVWCGVFGFVDEEHAGMVNWTSNWLMSNVCWGLYSRRPFANSHNGYLCYPWMIENTATNETEAISDAWHVIAVRYPNPTDNTRVLIDGVPLTLPGFTDSDKGDRAYRDSAPAERIEFQAFQTGSFSAAEDCNAWECTELRAVAVAHSDITMYNISKKLAEKYGLDHA